MPISFSEAMRRYDDDEWVRRIGKEMEKNNAIKIDMSFKENNWRDWNGQNLGYKHDYWRQVN